MDVVRRVLITSNKLNILEYTYNIILQQIRQSDTKASILLSISLVFTSAILFSISTLGIIITHYTKQSQEYIFIIDLILLVTYLIFFSVGLILLIMVLFPRIKGDSTPSLIYFGKINTLTKQQFIEQFSDQTPEDLEFDLLSQIYIISTIATWKYQKIQSASIMILISYIFGLVFLAYHSICLGYSH